VHVKGQRITEFKHLTGQAHPEMSIVYGFPQSEGDPYYPIPRAEITSASAPELVAPSTAEFSS
jgi:UDP-galactopyranose mutase